MKTIIIILLVFCSILYIQSILTDLTHKKTDYKLLRAILTFFIPILSGLFYYL